MNSERNSCLRVLARSGAARLALCLSVVALGVIAGCATHQAARKAMPPPKDNMAQTRQLVGDSLKASQAALRSLDRISALTNTCPPELFAQLARETHRLNVDSLKVRARAQAMKERGPAYFEQWHLNLARHPDPQVRSAAAQARERLDESFGRVEQSFQPLSGAFKPFQAGLRRLVSGLEKDPASAQADSSKALIRSATENGRNVVASLTSVLKELDSAAMLLLPAKSSQTFATPSPRTHISS
jgi:hypothetical protein